MEGIVYLLILHSCILGIRNIYSSVSAELSFNVNVDHPMKKIQSLLLMWPLPTTGAQTCIYCGVETNDPLSNIIDLFESDESVAVKRLHQYNKECLIYVIPSIRCDFNGIETEEEYLYPPRTSIHTLRHWYFSKRYEASRKTPMTRNLSSVRTALLDTRPIVLSFIDANVLKRINEIYAEVKDSCPECYFIILDTTVENIQRELADVLGRRLEPHSFYVRQYGRKDAVVGSTFSLTAEKLRSLIQIVRRNEKRWLTASELFEHHSSTGKMKKISHPTLIYVFMSFHPHLGYDLHMLHHSQQILEHAGLNLTLRYFSVDTHLEDIRHEQDADFIRSMHQFIIAFHNRSIPFHLPSIGPSDLLSTLIPHLNTLGYSSFIRPDVNKWYQKLQTETLQSPQDFHKRKCSNETKKELPQTPPDAMPMPFSDTVIANVDNEKPSIPLLKGLPLMDKDLWLKIVNSTDSRYNPFETKPHFFFTKIEVIIVVYTISPGCSHCDNSWSIFLELKDRLKRGILPFQKQKSTVHQVTSIFTYNCKGDFDFCASQIGPVGYPGVVAYRRLPVREAVHCSSEKRSAELASYVRLPYHGVMMSEDLLFWISRDVISPSTQVAVRGAEIPASHDGRGLLIIRVLPPWSKKIPRSRVRKIENFFCLDCVQFACERLMGHVRCIVQLDEAEDAEIGRIQHRFVVTRVTFVRADNVSADVMKISTPLHATIEAHGKIHNFHKPHRYDLNKRETCEDDHGRCTDLIIHFTKDHNRLPVTELTDAFLHRDDSVLSSGRPVLVAMVHTSNLTEENATFSAMLQDIGKTLYDRVVVTALNVDDHSSWANRFFPVDYHMKMIDSEELLPMYRYPRFCMLHWNDHRHMAFFPKVEIGSKSSYKAEEVMKFVDDYFVAPEKYLQQSELF